MPLFGHFCCRLAAQLDCMTKDVHTGTISINNKKCWARLRNFTLNAWESRKLAEDEQPPVHSIPINRETVIQKSSSSGKEIRVSNNMDGCEKTSSLKLESTEEAQKWLRHLTDHVEDHLRWKHAAESVQEVPYIESTRNSFISKRQGSLYDETPLIGRFFYLFYSGLQNIFIKKFLLNSKIIYFVLIDKLK